MGLDHYFMRIAGEIAQNSPCFSRKVGAVLVKNRTIISSGYNEPPQGCKGCNEREIEFYEALDKQPSQIRVEARDGVCPRRYMGYKSGEGLHLCQAVHAERQALIQAARNGISTLNTTMYCWCSIPCFNCMKELINSGVKRIVYFKGEDYDKYSRVLMLESGIQFEEIDYNLLGEKNYD